MPIFAPPSSAFSETVGSPSDLSFQTALEFENLETATMNAQMSNDRVATEGLTEIGEPSLIKIRAVRLKTEREINSLREELASMRESRSHSTLHVNDTAETTSRNSF